MTTLLVQKGNLCLRAGPLSYGAGDGNRTHSIKLTSQIPSATSLIPRACPAKTGWRDSDLLVASTNRQVPSDERACVD
jgi:hypothetical protein